MVNSIFNPYDTFRDSFNTEYFVDKTELIFEINKVINSFNKENFICMSLPENFNKSIITNMIIAYYQYSEKESIIFNNTKLAEIKTQNHDKKEWKKYLSKFNIIKLNIKKHFLKYNIKEGIEKIKSDIIYEIRNTIKNFKFRDENKLRYIFEDIYINSNRKIVLIINDWDSVYQYKKDDEFFQEYHKFLESLIINKDCLALTFMTGILSIHYYYKDSNLLYVFENFTMFSPKWMAKYIGYNDEEVKMLCEKYLNKAKNNSSNIPIKRRKLNKEDNERSIYKINNNKIKTKELIHVKEAKITYEKIKSFYYGYRLLDTWSNKKYEIYCPNSIDNALKENSIGIYQKKKDIDLHGIIQSITSFKIV